MKPTINQFPWKLHEVLRIAEETGQEAIISWLPHGKGFRVHNSQKFEAGLMKECFKQTKFKSFIRQLNLWGFRRVTFVEAEKGAYYHPYFLRGRPELCHMMIRQGNKKAPWPPSNMPIANPHVMAGIGTNSASIPTATLQHPLSQQPVAPLYQPTTFPYPSKPLGRKQQVQGPAASSWGPALPNTAFAVPPHLPASQTIARNSNSRVQENNAWASPPVRESTDGLESTATATSACASYESATPMAIAKTDNSQSDPLSLPGHKPTVPPSIADSGTLAVDQRVHRTVLCIAQISLKLFQILATVNHALDSKRNEENIRTYMDESSTRKVDLSI